MQELLRYARALLLLELKKVELAAQVGKGPTIRPEVLLADAGFGGKEIAEILGKNYGAVAKTLSRARIARAKETTQEDREAGGNNGE